MTENTERGREYYCSIEAVVREFIHSNEYSDHSYEEFSAMFAKYYSALVEELYFDLVEELHSNGLVDRSVFVREVTSPNEPTRRVK